MQVDISGQSFFKALKAAKFENRKAYVLAQSLILRPSYVSSPDESSQGLKTL